jgi:hypothetical protein
VPGIEPGPPDLLPRTLTTRPQRRSLINKHNYKFTKYVLEKSKVAQHAYKEDHKTEAKVLQSEQNITYRK